MDLNTIQTISAVVQAVFAILAFILTWALSKQTTKIRELTDVTDALIKQNREFTKQTQELINHTEEFRKSNSIMQSNFDLQNKLSIQKQIAFFRKKEYLKSMNQNSISLTLKNFGQPALKLNWRNGNSEEFSVQFDRHEVHESGEISVMMFFPGGVAGHNKFSFEITFQDAYNRNFSQKITEGDASIGYLAVDYEVSAPIEII